MAYGFYDNKTKADIEEIVEDVGETKVDKVEGKVLSDNDYSDTDKAIVDNATTGLATKVDKVTGKQLSTTDFTPAYRTKIDEATYNFLGVNGEEKLSENGTNYYTLSSPFVCPHDGYVTIGPAYNSGYAQLSIKVSSNISINARVNYSSDPDGASVFVKRGMRIFATSSGAYSSVYYVPQESYT